MRALLLALLLLAPASARAALLDVTIGGEVHRVALAEGGRTLRVGRDTRGRPVVVEVAHVPTRLRLDTPSDAPWVHLDAEDASVRVFGRRGGRDVVLYEGIGSLDGDEGLVVYDAPPAGRRRWAGRVSSIVTAGLLVQVRRAAR